MKEYIHEQAKEIEVFDHCDVLVVGAGPPERLRRFPPPVMVQVR